MNPRALGRPFVASVAGLTLVGACAASAPVPPARDGWTGDPDAYEAAKRGPKAPEDAGPPSADGGPRCPYGELNDPHRGFVRCLLPDERDAGWLPPPSQPGPPKADPPKADPPKADPPKADPPKADPPKAEPPRPSAPPHVEIGAPKFENGEVTRVEKSLAKAAPEIAKCVADHGGLSADTGSIKVQFLVRSRGRAEGVEVLAAKGVVPEAASCVRVLLKNKAIGAPSADPVGVTVTISLKQAK